MCVERAVQQNARKNKHQSHEIVYTINKVCGAQRLRPNSRSILKIQTGTHAEHAISQDVVHRMRWHSPRCAYHHLHAARITSGQMFKYLSAEYEHINFYSTLSARNCQHDNSLRSVLAAAARQFSLQRQMQPCH